nr:MAG TPA: hypothetical protein [Caudoviricetes sp.]
MEHQLLEVILHLCIMFQLSSIIKITYQNFSIETKLY